MMMTAEVFALRTEMGRHLLFDVDRMNRMVIETRRTIYRVNLPPHTLGVERPYLDILRKSMKRHWPIIMAQIDGLAYVIDGQHRVALTHEAGQTFIHAWVFGPLEWPQFIIKVPEKVAAKLAEQGDKVDLADTKKAQD